MAIDDDQVGGQTHLVLYRPGARNVWVVGRQEPTGARR